MKNWEEYFTYDGRSGDLIWKTRPLSHFATLKACAVTNARYAGKVAGRMRPDGYIRVGVDGKTYQAHRIIFEMKKGPLTAKDDIDHRDTVTSNNKLRNLRKCTRAQNRRNAGCNKNNTTGFKGVSWHRASGKFAAKIGVNRKRKHLGLFESPELAHAAYCDAAIIHHGEFARTA